ncbi:hypothetical protein ACODNH_00505 (plasmid) [Haloarcula sp. NS06]|uniref:hypothetical protein n=1 Tax=Haloarcula sp. NS06 TaxID=3409688 RepID=UPI003DA74B19
MHHITIPEETDISNRQWKRAWNPINILVRYVVASFVLASVLLIPLAWVVDSYALGVFILLPFLGISLSIIVWRRSCKAVNTTYQEVLDGISNWSNLSNDEVQVFVSELNGSGEQYGVDPAQKYTLTYVEVAEEYTLIKSITVDLANLEPFTKSEKIVSQQIVSQSFESGTFRLRSSIGNWNIDCLKRQ